MAEYEVIKTYFMTADSLEDVKAVHDALDNPHILEIYRVSGLHRIRLYRKEEE
ncbi:unnamed protein product [marine sediment metagenome]|uniref:Uncharacterized protein n=1 Tax=marine sediment metagenome TaxID=412755 RepID=X0TG41_9ZZZZ